MALDDVKPVRVKPQSTIFDYYTISPVIIILIFSVYELFYEYRRLQQKLSCRMPIMKEKLIYCVLISELCSLGVREYLRVSEANEVPISSHVWVGLSTFNRL